MISLETARQLLDFRGGVDGQMPRLSRERAEEQLEGAVAIHNILEQHRIAYLADEVGLGKTYVALGAFALFRHYDPRFRMLVLAPKENIQRKWTRELHNFVRNNIRFADLRVRSVQGTPARPPVLCHNLYELARETMIDPDRDFFVRLTSFSFGLADEPESWKHRRDAIRELFPWIGEEAFDLKSKPRFKENYARAVGSALPELDLVIVDEGHNLKHGVQKHAALRNRLLALTLGKRAKRVLFLSATPVEDDYVHLWNQLDVFGFGDVAPELREPGVSDEEKREIIARFLIRRVSSIRVQEHSLTKNLYRREWRGGGVSVHDEALPVPDERQRLIVALVQKKVSELLAHERFGHSFQIGMLASFESFLQTANITDGDDSSTFDDAEQTDDTLERQGLDVDQVNRLAASYEKRFGGPLPHPKMDALVARLRDAFDSGRKALVFVRRVASVKELQAKLEAEYDRWLFTRLRTELRRELQPQLETVFEAYRAEHTSRSLNRPAQPQGDEVDVVSDAGGIETFFAWFFRGEGPDTVLSGAYVSRRFQLPQFAQSSFFEDNHVAALLGARPNEVFSSFCRYLRQPSDEVRGELERRAGALLPGERRRRHRHLFTAFQYAALSMLADAVGPLRDDARFVLAHLLTQTPGDHSPAPLGDWLERPTFFTELRARDALYRELWVPEEEDRLRFEQRFRRRELRRELLGSIFRLGHASIDLYVTIANQLGRLERGADGEDLDIAMLAQSLLDLLEQQRTQARFRAYQELAEASAQFDLIVDVNAPNLWERQPAEVSRELGNLLGEQKPVGGMWGEVSRRLVSQFRMPGYPLVLISTDLLQEGEDLHLFCSDVYHYGISWMPSSMEQRIGRIDRVCSQTERRLTSLHGRPDGQHLLQVYYPYIQETVEVFQVNRVLARMDRFLDLMHHTLGSREDLGENRIHLLDEIGRAARPRPAPLREPLRSAFPVWPALLGGPRAPLAVSPEAHEKLLQRFYSVQETLERQHGAVWLTRAGRNSRVGSVRIGNRTQALTLFLHSIHGHALLRCVSPVGSIDTAARVDEIVEASKKLQARIAAVYDPRFRQYNLTAESDVLLGSPESDASRAWWLLRSTAAAADRLEDILTEADASIEQVREDLHQEPTFER